MDRHYFWRHHRHFLQSRERRWGNLLSAVYATVKDILTDNSYFSATYRYEDDIVVMDKTGRLQRFHRSGDFYQVAARIDAYLGNGFVVKEDKAILVCSGIVVDKVRI